LIFPRTQITGGGTEDRRVLVFRRETFQKVFSVLQTMFSASGGVRGEGVANIISLTVNREMDVWPGGDDNSRMGYLGSKPSGRAGSERHDWAPEVVHRGLDGQAYTPLEACSPTSPAAAPFFRPSSGATFYKFSWQPSARA